MKKILVTLVSVSILFSFFSVGFTFAKNYKTMAEEYADISQSKLKDGLSGWNVMSDFYRKRNLLDGMSVEWDYFSLHDKNNKFTGVVAYLVCDPEGKMGGDNNKINLMVSGANVAGFGKFGSTGKKYADYVTIGLDFKAGKNEKSFYAKDSEGRYGEMIPVRGNGTEPDKLILKGKTNNLEWDLEVSQLWAGSKSYPEYSSPNFDTLHKRTYEIGNDMGLIEKVPYSLREHWTVNMPWPSTRVVGTMKDLNTGEVVDVDGVGYRENSFGRWAFAAGGWDFYFVSDLEKQVQFTLQTYHFDTKDLDYAQVDFVDNGAPKSIIFRAKDAQLGWEHPEWEWCNEARQCRPVKTNILAKNKDYTVEAYADNKDDYAVLLSNKTPVVKAYEITTLFPVIKGRIIRNSDGATVTEFCAQGGGEFSCFKDLIELNDYTCNALAKKIFSYPMPK